MKRRHRAAPWKTGLHQSDLLPELRRLYAEMAAKSKLAAPWYELAQRAQLNPATVQRLLACTKIDRANSGRHLSSFEALAKAMGYRCVLRRIADG